MTKEIKYSGYTAQPSDYDCKDGELASVLNLIPERGAMRPVASPDELFYVRRGNASARVWHVHETHTYKHFIASYMSGDIVHLEWISEQGSETDFFPSETSILGGDILQITSIGNILVILTTGGLKYFIWKEDSNNYKYLGSRIPETVLSFGLQGKIIDEDYYETAHLTMDPWETSSYSGRFDPANAKTITTAVMAQVNKFIADEGDNAGRFIMPFLVRYAYRLYDGSLSHHSSPILMIAASDTAPIAVRTFSSYRSNNNNTGYDQLGFRVIGVAHKLDYAVKSQGQINELKKWKDIVSSVDIFISAPLTKYNQNGEIKEMEGFNETDWYCVCKQEEQNPSMNTDDYPLRYQHNTLYRLRENCPEMDGAHHHVTYGTRCVLPQYSSAGLNSKIKECGTFYFLKSIPLDELTTERTIIDVASDYLPSLVNREVMSDDYDSHDTLIPDNSFVYNSRLNIANLKKKLYRGPEPLNIFNYTDGWAWDNYGAYNAIYQHPGSGHSYLEYDDLESLCVYVYIKEDGREFVVKSATGTIAQKAPITYFYFPNVNAYKALFVRAGRKYEVKLTQHPMLNGAVYFNGFGEMEESAGATIPTESVSVEVVMRNKIYTSDVDNPFFFPARGVNSVGTGVVIGVSTAAKALSQGQFGQFPLYAFTSDGVWALEVSKETGGFMAVQPISRDVCINPNSITQLDNAVLFATDRGIMLIAGSETSCITDKIDNQGDPFRFHNMPLADNVKTLLGITPGTSDELTEKRFRLFLEGCQMLYAYKRQAVIVFNPDYGGYAYIFSLESKAWGRVPSSIKYRILSYPEAYAQRDDNVIIDYAEEDTVPAKQFLITRPLKLDAPDILKTVDTIIQRGVFQKGHVSCILYGSRDLLNWFPVATSTDHYLRGFRGTPYKYFRIALVCTLSHEESITGATIQFTPRLTDQHR